MNERTSLRSNVIVLLVLNTALLCCPWAGLAEDQAHRIPQEALAGWQRFVNLQDNMILEGTQIKTSPNGPPLKFHLKVTVRRPFACMEERKLDPGMNKETGTLRVTCWGPRYSFVLERAGKDDPIIVKALVSSDPILHESYFKHLDNFLHTVCEAPCRVVGRIGELSKAPEFAVKSIKDVNEGGRALVALEFTYDVPGTLRPRAVSLRLDPATDWAVVNYEGRGIDETNKDVMNIVRGANVYEARQGKLVPSKVVSTTIDKYASTNHENNYTVEWTTEHVSFSPIDDAAFSLTAYGLSEISTGSKSAFSFSVHSWGLWASLGVAGIAAVLLRLTRPKARA